MRSGRAVLALIALAGILACAAVTRPTAALFTAATTSTGTFTVDRLGNSFAVAPGSSKRPGTTTAIAAGDVDTQALTFGTVPSSQAFASVFTVRNVTGNAQQAVLTLAGAPQLAAPVFTSTGTATDTIPAGATRTVQVATVPTIAGRGTGTVRLRLGSATWLYRDYATTIDLAPQAPASLTATQRPAGAIRLAWGASATVTGLAGYTVYRKSGAGAYAKLNAAPQAGTTLDDTTAVDGTAYTYVVRAVTTAGVTLESADSPAATATADATPPGQPTAVALANGGGAGGAYVNAANEASASVSISLPAGSLAGDTVTLTLTSGATTVTRTAAASSGAGTITISGLDLRGLADGTIALGASSADAAGNVSASRSGSAPKDTAAPGTPTASYNDQDGSSADVVWGTAEQGASVVVTRISPAPSASYDASEASGYYWASVGAHKNVRVTYSVVATDAAGNASAAATVTART